MKRLSSKTMLALLAASVFSDPDGPQWQEPRLKEQPTPPAKKQKPIPKGCKEYFFDAAGNFATHRMRMDECVFICVALNDTSAISKFKKWSENERARNSK